MTDQAERLTLPAFVLVVLFGGTNFVAGRFTLRELPPFWAAGIRLAAASALLFSLVWFQRLPLPRGRALLGALAYGLLGFGLGYAFAYWGFQRVAAGPGALVMAVTPLFTFGLALMHRQEAFRWRPLFGGGLAIVGIGIMSSRPATTAVPILSLLAIIAFALANAEASVVAKQFPKSHPITTNAIAMLTGTVVLLLLSILFHERWVIPARASTWIALAYLVFLGSSAAFVLFLFVLRSWPASKVAYMFVLFPLVAVTLSAWLERIRLSPSLVIGGVVVLLGVFVGSVTQVPFARTPHRMGSEPCLTCAE